MNHDLLLSRLSELGRLPVGLLWAGHGSQVTREFLGLLMARAVGTSLAVIAIIDAGELATAAAELDPAWIFVTTVFAALALAGTLVGAGRAASGMRLLLRPLRLRGPGQRGALSSSCMLSGSRKITSSSSI